MRQTSIPDGDSLLAQSNLFTNADGGPDCNGIHCPHISVATLKRH